MLASILVDTVGTGMFMPLVLLYLSRINGVPPTVAGPVITIANLVSFTTLPGISRIVDHLGGRNAMMLCSALSGCGYTAYFLARSPTSIGVAALLIALGDRVNGTSWPILSAVVFGRERLTPLFAMLNSAKTIAMGGGALAATLALSLGSRGGLRVALAADVLTYGVGLALLLGVPDQRKTRPRTPADRPRLMTAAANKPFMELIVTQTALSFGWILPTVAFPLYIPNNLGLSAALVSGLLVLRYAVISIGQVPLVKLAGGWPRRSVFAASGACALGSLAITCVTPVLSGRAMPVALCAATALMAGSEILSKPTAAAAAVGYAPEGGEAPYMVIFQTTWTFAYAVGPLLIGVGLQAPTLLWLVIGVLIAIGLAVNASSRRPRTRVEVR